MLDDTVVDVVLIAVGVIAIVVAIDRGGPGVGADRSPGSTRLLASTDPERRAEAAVGAHRARTRSLRPPTPARTPATEPDPDRAGRDRRPRSPAASGSPPDHPASPRSATGPPTSSRPRGTT